jgi:hypothetical protein
MKSLLHYHRMPGFKHTVNRIEGLALKGYSNCKNQSPSEANSSSIGQENNSLL